MSTTTTDMARSPFSTAAFAQLVRRLRHTNARYNQIARQVRCRMRPTHHAKRRAYWAGLRVDTSRARACPDKYVSVLPPPVLDTSVATPPPTHAAPARDAYMRGKAPRHSPKVVVVVRKHRRRDGRQRIMLRLPPFNLSLDVDSPRGAFEGPVPGAPRLKPKQLPHDETGLEEIMLGPPSPFVDGPDSLLTPSDLQVYSGLCITIPPRSLKRKLQDVEADDPAVDQPRRILKARWNGSQ